MTTIKNEGLFGDTIPGVYIDSIILEDTSSSPDRVANPHIRDRVRRPSSIVLRAATGPAPRRLNTTLNITMKESDNHIFSSLIGREDLHEYLKIGIVQSRNAGVLSFSEAKELISSNPGTDEWTGTTSEGLDIRTVSLTNPEFNIDRGVYETLDDGTRIYNISFSHTFTFSHSDTTNPENLSYYVMCYMDMNGFLRSYGIPNPSLSTRMNGKMSSEIVFKDSELVSTSHVFTTGDGKIWPGMVEISSDGRYTTPTTALSSSEDLFLTDVPNTTLQDFRALRPPKKEDTSLLSEDLTERSSKSVFSSQREFRVGSEKVISEFKTSRKHDGAINFLFDIDIGKLLQSKSPFAGVISNLPAALPEIIDLSHVILLQLMRVRSVEKESSNSAGAVIKKPVVKNTQDSKPSIVARVVAGNASSSDNIRKVKMSIPFVGKVSYTGTDTESASITDGKYSYYVEIEMLDGIKIYLKRLLSELNSNKALLYGYLNEFNKPSLSEHLTVRNDPHVYDVSEEVRSTSNRRENNVNRFTGKLSRTAIEKMYRRYPTSPKPWIDPLATFSEAYNAVFGVPVEASITNMIHPHSATLEGLLLFTKLYDHLIEKLTSAVSDTMGAPVTKSQKNYQSSTPPTIKARKHFQYVLDASTPDSLGYQYITTPTTTNGLSTLSLREWDQRVSEESSKWFAEDSTSIRISTTEVTTNQQVSRNDYSFLSPQYVHLSTNIYDIRTLTLGTNEYSRIYENIHSSNSNKTMAKRLATNSSLLDSFYFEGATLYDPQAPPRRLSSGHVTDLVPSASDSKKRTIIFDAVDKLFVKKNSPTPGPKSQMPSGSQSFLSSYFLGSEESSNINFYNLRNTGNKIETLSRGEIAALPNQVLAIIASSMTPGTSNHDFFPPSGITTGQDPILQVNVNLLRRVEYLAIDSRWQLLTRGAISGLSSGQIVCRLSPYQNTKISININEKMVLPLYDELFLIDVGNFVSSAEATSIPAIPVRKRILSKLMSSSETTPPPEFITTNPGLGYL